VDDGGRRLLDLSASWAAASLGYGHPAVRGAVASALASTAGCTGLSVANKLAITLAEELLATLPEPLTSESSVYLGHAGSDANTAVIRAARAATARPLIVSFARSYHGGLGEAQAASGFAANGGDGAAGAYRFLPYPTDEPAAAEVLSAAAALLGRGDVAMVVVEPVMSDGGVHIPAKGFISSLAELCSGAGTLLAVDEVKAGLGRTGGLHAFTAENVVPDVLVLGKGLGGCLPLSAAIAPRRIFDAAPGALLLTTAGNPVCAAAGLAVLRTIIGDRLSEQAGDVGRRLRNALERLSGRFPVVQEIRGRGLMLGVQIGGPQARPDAATFTAMLVYRCWELGAVVYPVGTNSDVVELTPPLILSPGEADLGAGIIGQGIEDVLAGRVPADAVAAYQGW
jgi:4-aminobutyrate aminotransferase